MAEAAGALSRGRIWAGAISAVSAVLVLAFPDVSRPATVVAPAIQHVQAAPGQQSPASEPSFRTQIVCNNCAPFTHAASLVNVNGELLAFWYQGLREGSFDVSIRSARFDGRTWSRAETVTDQMATSGELGRFVKTLGNPVPVVGHDGTLTLFYIAVGMRGWATAYIAAKQSHDGGRTWTAPRRIVTSPIWNLSTMIKTRPLLTDDGRILLPAYWSLGTTYPVLIEFTHDLKVRDIKRIAPRGYGLQPAVIDAGGKDMRVMLRTLPKQIGKVGLQGAHSPDNGESWGKPAATGFANPGSPVALVSLDGERLALVFNERSEESLAVAVSNDGGSSWQKRAAFPSEDALAHDAKAYPFAVASADGTIDVVFSCARYTSICHARFNRGWVDRQAVAIGAAQ